MSTLFSIAAALLVGLLVSRPAKRLGLPAVTAYLIAGILVGPFGLGMLGIEGIGFNTTADADRLSLFSEVALGFIAFAIGNEFRKSQLREIGKSAAVIGVIQALTAAALVDIALIGLHFIVGDKLPLSVAITLGAIATATAPAATLMVIRQYKAKGPVTSLLLSVVAIDDMVGLVVFSISFGVAKALLHGSVSVLSVLVEPLLEVLLSILLGALLGALLTFLEGFFHSNSKRMTLSITFVMIGVGIAMSHFALGGIHISFSSLLVCMSMGTVFCNLCDFSPELMAKTDRWTAPLFVLFFVVSGAEMDFMIFKDFIVIGIGLIYVVVRSIGKYYGSFGSAKLMKCAPNVTKYLGITLLPQAGVALGMSLKASELGTTEGALIRGIVLFGVLIFELIGPTLTKMALKRAGEISGTATTARQKPQQA